MSAEQTQTKKTYSVTIRQVTLANYQVEASSREEAEKAADELYAAYGVDVDGPSEWSSISISIESAEILEGDE